MAGNAVVGRFAPSPTGIMHAGNVFAALNSWLLAKSQGGKVVLRIEDLDEGRSRKEFADAAMRDFEALGLSWDEGPFYQHDRQEAYMDAFEKLRRAGLTYPCYCTRAEINAQSAPHGMGEKAVYPGRCRRLSPQERIRLEERLASDGRSPSQRLEVPGETVEFDDLYQGRFAQRLDTECGDFVVRRSDGGFAYQLAVVVDDAAQGVNCVARGYDLLVSTPQQIHLQRLLGLDTPQYAHFPLLCAEDGRRLAKRNKDAALDELLAVHGSPEAVLGHVAYVGGLQPEDAPATPEQLLTHFDAASIREKYEGTVSIAYG